MYIRPKRYFMKNLKILERFASELEKGSAKTMSYEQICCAVGLRPSRVDAASVSVLGVSGRVVAECYRCDIPASLVMARMAPLAIPDCASLPR